MNNPPTRVDLLLSLQRALLDEVHAELRAASIEADPISKTVMLRLEYASEPSGDARACGSSVATEILADLPTGWALEDERLARPLPEKWVPLEHLAYRRFEGWSDP
jgi:hypothetical protein